MQTNLRSKLAEEDEDDATEERVNSPPPLSRRIHKKEPTASPQYSRMHRGRKSSPNPEQALLQDSDGGFSKQAVIQDCRDMSRFLLRNAQMIGPMLSELFARKNTLGRAAQPLTWVKRSESPQLTSRK